MPQMWATMEAVADTMNLLQVCYNHGNRFNNNNKSDVHSKISGKIVL